MDVDERTKREGRKMLHRLEVGASSSEDVDGRGGFCHRSEHCFLVKGYQSV